MGKARLDLLLVQRGLADSRARSQAMIMAGEVLVNGRVADKPGALVPEDAEIIARPPFPYVSRGGLKLEKALDHFRLVMSGLVVIDVGASTGGFTDALLKRGARRVYAIDVGYGQLDWRLRNDPRVVVRERTNIRYLEQLPEIADAAVVDVSFISLTVVLPATFKLVKPDGWVIALVKPQFEAGRAQVGKGGVVKDPAVHRQVLEKLANWAEANGVKVLGLVPSPILGPAGNREFLILLSRVGEEIDVSRGIAECVDRS
ncbi:MAG: TlyA family RNA methyltransferase [Chloroflexi bacterium]|nr:TlyA family RNA methyltransferase [Chloroflexota bacterium]